MNGFGPGSKKNRIRIHNTGIKSKWLKNLVINYTFVHLCTPKKYEGGGGGDDKNKQYMYSPGFLCFFWKRSGFKMQFNEFGYIYIIYSE